MSLVRVMQGEIRKGDKLLVMSTGRVHEVLIEEGQRVEAGQVMATLDPVDADASRALAYSQREASRSQVGSAQAQLKEAEANAAADKQRKETVEAQNSADSLIHSTEKAIAEHGALGAIAEPLYTTYVVPFEITGILLLVAIVGALVLAKREV